MIRSATTSLGRITGEILSPAAPLLQPYQADRPPLRRFFAKALFIAFCVFLGIFYGFFFAVFPPILMIYAAIPILLLAVVVIWALPDRGRAPTRLLRRLFFAYLIFMIMWPVYVSIQLPGLPWISFRRLIGFPMAIILLVCLSTSGKFRSQLTEVLRAMPVLWRMVTLFAAIEFVTLFMSAIPFMSANLFLNNLVMQFAMFFVAAWVLAQPGNAERWAKIMIGMALALCLMGLAEARNQQILWANHIPSFLAITDPSVERTLTAQFREGYRVTTTFTIALAFGEFLAIAVPFLLHWLLPRRGLGPKVALAALDGLVLAMIVMTHVRLGIVGWLVAHAVYGSLWALRRWQRNKSDLLGPAIALAYPVAVILFVISMFTVNAVKFRTIGGGSTGYSDAARMDQIHAFLPLLIRNPFGYGLGRAAEVLGYHTPGGLLTVDTYIITVGLDFGLAGLILYFGMIGFALWKMCLLALRSSEGEDSWSMPLAGALAAYVIIRFVFAQEDNSSLLYMMLGMAAALSYRAKQIASASPATASSPASTTGSGRPGDVQFA